jgi:hypothetical protein
VSRWTGEVIDVLLRCADEPPSSVAEAQFLEACIAGDLASVPELEDFGVALASYEPTEKPEPGVLGYEGLRFAAREALHDLGRHDRCLHGIPLDERP